MLPVTAYPIEKQDNTTLLLPQPTTTPPPPPPAPLPPTYQQPLARLHYIFHVEFFRTCAENISGTEITIYTLCTLGAVLGAAFNAMRAIESLLDGKREAQDVLSLLSYSMALAVWYWVQRVAFEKMKMAWVKRRANRTLQAPMLA